MMVLSTGFSRAKLGESYLKAAPGAVLCDDAHVRWIEAGTNKTSQMFVMNISHLQKTRDSNHIKAANSLESGH